MATAFVTGGAGFIGSNLVDRLLSRCDRVVAYDNLSTGQDRFLDDARRNPAFELVKGDLLDRDTLTAAMVGCDTVFHLAANADVRFGLDHPGRDLEQNTIATFSVLEAMRAAGVRRIAFSSTGSVYGEPEQFPTPETAPFPVQTSLYGASKLACEGLLQAYATGFGFQCWIFRFVSVLGRRYTHGHVLDFYNQLLAHPDRLDVLGDGTQRKSYIDIDDCIRGVLMGVEKADDAVNVFNLGTAECCRVSDSIEWITGHLGLSPEVRFTGGSRGWVGDSPFIFLDCSRIGALGWQPALGIREAVIGTVDYLTANPWVLAARP